MKIGFFISSDLLLKRKYEIGEISQKTGKKKIAPGKWVHVKKKDTALTSKFGIGVKRQLPGRSIEYRKQVGEEKVPFWGPESGYEQRHAEKMERAKVGQVVELNGIPYKKMKDGKFKLQTKYNPEKNTLSVKEIKESDLKLLASDPYYRQQFLKANQAYIGYQIKRVQMMFNNIEYADYMQIGNQAFLNVLNKAGSIREANAFGGYLGRSIFNSMISMVTGRAKKEFDMTESINKVVSGPGGEKAEMGEVMKEMSDPISYTPEEEVIEKERAERANKFASHIEDMKKDLREFFTKPREYQKDIDHLLDSNTPAQIIKQGYSRSKVAEAVKQKKERSERADKWSKFLDYLAEGKDAEEAAKRIGVTKQAASKMIHTRIQPIASKYLFRSIEWQSFMQYLNELAGEYKVPVFGFLRKTA